MPLANLLDILMYIINEILIFMALMCKWYSACLRKEDLSYATTCSWNVVVVFLALIFRSSDSAKSLVCSSQDSQVVSEDGVDIKASEESKEETSIEESPKPAVNGTEIPERRELGASDAAGALHFGPLQDLRKRLAVSLSPVMQINYFFAFEIVVFT